MTAVPSNRERVRRGALSRPQPGSQAPRRDPHRGTRQPEQRAAQRQPEPGRAQESSRAEGAMVKADGRASGAFRGSFTQTLAVGIGLVLLFSYIGWICMEMGYRVHMGDQTLEAIAGAMFLAAFAALIGARSRR